MVAHLSYEKNWDYAQKNRDELLKKYRNKFVLIHNGKVIGAYDTYEKAAEEGIRLFGVTDIFLVYQALENEVVNFVMEAAL